MSGVSLARAPTHFTLPCSGHGYRGASEDGPDPLAGLSGSEAENSMLGGEHASSGDEDLVLWALTWGHPEVGGNPEGACPSCQQDSLVAGLQDDGHAQIHASVRGQLGSQRRGLLVQGREGAEGGSLAGGSHVGSGFSSGAPARPRPHLQPTPALPPPPQLFLVPLSPLSPAEPPTWSGSLAVAPGKGSAERSSCPRRRPQ